MEPFNNKKDNVGSNHPTYLRWYSQFNTVNNNEVTGFAKSKPKKIIAIKITG